MTQTIHLAAHDPLPQGGPHALVLRRFGEDDPRAVVTEIIFTGPQGFATAAPTLADTKESLASVVEAARELASARGLKRVYVMDRTAGLPEQIVIAQHGDHSFADIPLSDTDLEGGELGSSLLDRAPDAGRMR
jgi:hypothetical protein